MGNVVGTVSNHKDVCPTFNDNEYGTKYIYTVDRDMRNIQRLIDKGYKIEWSVNESYCIINKITFNVPKRLFIRKMGEDYCNAVSL